MNFRLLLLLIFNLQLGLTAFGDTANTVESLQQLLSHENNVARKFELCNRLVDIYSFTNKKKAAEQIGPLQQLASESGDEHLQLIALEKLCYLFARSGHLDSAEIILNRLAVLPQSEISGQDLAFVNKMQGIVFVEKSNYNEAMKYFQRSYEMYDSLRDYNGKSSSLLEMGKILTDQAQYEQAAKYFRESNSIAHLNNDLPGLFTSNQNIGNIFFIQQQHDSAEKYYRIELSYARLLGEEPLASACINFADLKVSQKKFNEATPYYENAIAYFIQNGNAKTNAKLFNSIAWCKYMQNQLDESLSYFEKSNQLNDSLKDYDLMIENYGFVSDIYADKKDFKNAYLFQTKLESAKDSMYKQLRAEKLLHLETEFETFRKEKENQLLKDENELTKTTLQRNRIVLIAGAICLVLFVILLLVVLRSNLHRLRNIDTLENLNQQLQLQRDEIVQMNNKLEIRALRAQMDPHFIFNCMSSIQELILKGDADVASNYLVKFSRLLRMVLENSEHDYVSLDKELEMVRLYLDLENIRLKDKFTYSINVDEELFEGEIMVPTLVLQPFAENALWHGLLNKENNRKLDITLKAEDDILICIVEDNGIGRKKAREKKMGMTKHASRGMKAIEERLLIIGKNLYEKSGLEIVDLYDQENNSCGTKVIIKIPIHFSRVV